MNFKNLFLVPFHVWTIAPLLTLLRLQREHCEKMKTTKKKMPLSSFPVYFFLNEILKALFGKDSG
ncbi:hypothetical protein DERF_005949 [Dermatophagoides farinae]|uniref:Uncharacterized protein n=1 Tax=Dermatophagoides farinae TaxID=6954 RepID=A0A922LBS1_DERFA|nr:hypothetical protein DERF_005949 [Dermatophagoides farinae]